MGSTMKNPKKNDRVTVEISGYASDGAGISHLPDGRVLFVKGALKGECVEAQLLKVGKSAAWGRVHRILEVSAHRIDTDCPYYPKCGGCQLRHMDYEEEIALKQNRVQEALRRLGGVEAEIEETHGAKKISRYRNKIQFPVSTEKGQINIGFYRARSHDVVDVPDCLLQPEAAGRLRQAVKEFMEEHMISAYDEKSHKGLVRHVFIRSNEKGESLCVLVVNGDSIPKEKELIVRLRSAEPGLCGLLLSVNKERTNVILGQKFRTLWGQDYLESCLCGFQFRLSAPSFYQVNREQTELLYARVLAFASLSGEETVLDLYCGIGTITHMLAKRAKRVIGAEIVEQAIKDAKDNAERNRVENIEFIAADAREAAELLEKRGERPHVICVDPPRKGLELPVIEAMVRMNGEKIVYVSCDPATLARDIKLFAERGYRLQKAEVVDLFPRTMHVETVCLMSRVEGK